MEEPVFAKSLAVPLAITGGMLLGACSSSVAPLAKTPPTTTTTTTKAPLTTSARYCQARDLKISFVRTTAATGTDFGQFDVMNTSNKPCLVQGYPSIRAFSSTGSAISLDVKDGGAPGAASLESAYNGKPKLLVLVPKRFALILAQWSSDGSCPKIAKLFFRLPGISSNFPVNLDATKTLDSTFGPCLGGVVVSPVELLGRPNAFG